MADKISGYGQGGVDISSTRSRNVSRADKSAEQRAARRAEVPTDDVRLTDTATSLKQIEARLAQLPDVDRARVEAIRGRLDSGQYQVNASRLATSFLRMERELI